CLYILALFFHCSLQHPDLHSFPTRRSSDLVDDAQAQVERVAHGLLPVVVVRERDRRVAVADRDRAARRDLLERVFLGGGRKGERSEEHTSELQSLAYLVCRLLLEKKKKKKT